MNNTIKEKKKKYNCKKILTYYQNGSNITT